VDSVQDFQEIHLKRLLISPTAKEMPNLTKGRLVNLASEEEIKVVIWSIGSGLGATDVRRYEFQIAKKGGSRAINIMFIKLQSCIITLITI
jgi:hypothetical protein